MIKSLPKLRLRAWLLIAITSALIPVLLLSVSQSFTSLERENAQRVEQLAAESRFTAQSIDEELTRAANLIDILAAQDPGVADCERIYNDFSDLVRATTFVIRAKPTGEVVCTWPAAAETSVVPLPAIARLNSETRSIRTKVMYGNSSETHIIGIVNAIPQDGEIEEFVSISLDVAELSNTAAQSIRSQEIKFGLVNSDGLVFDHPVLTQMPIDEIKSSAIEERIQLSDQLDGRYIVTARAIEGTNLYAVLYRPAPTWWSIISSQAVRLALLPLLAILSVFLAIWWAIESLVLKWLRRLQRVSDIYGAGRLGLTDEETITKAPLEVSALAAGMDQMATRIGQRQSDLEAALTMRDAAVKETHHRVKNNLQIVSSFLNLEIRNAQFDETKSVLRKAGNRISALSIVHQTLYQHERVDEVHTKPFLEMLLPHLESALLMEDLRIALSHDIEDALIRSDDANPLALLILELITNSVKHAFDERGGEIHVSLKNVGDHLEVIVRDNGVGESHSDSEHGGTGTRLIQAFVRQLSGSFDIDTHNGRTTKIVFPKK